MRTRSRLLMLVAVIAVSGPWTGASADDWPDPAGDPFAGQGVVLADASFPSTGGVGFRVTLPTGGDIEVLGWIDTGSPRSGHGSAADDTVAIGGLVWNPETSQPYDWFLDAWNNGGPDARVFTNGTTVVDQSTGGSDLWLGFGAGSGVYAPGTYDIVIWGATNSPSATTRFRLHVPSDATLVNETTSTTTFFRGLRQFSGTASAAVDTPVNETSASAAVAESTSVDVAHTLFGEFEVGSVQRPEVPTPPPARYTGPDGTHAVPVREIFNGSPSGSYTFTLDNTVVYTEPFVAGADLATP